MDRREAMKTAAAAVLGGPSIAELAFADRQTGSSRPLLPTRPKLIENSVARSFVPGDMVFDSGPWVPEIPGWQKAGRLSYGFVCTAPGTAETAKWARFGAWPV